MRALLVDGNDGRSMSRLGDDFRPYFKNLSRNGGALTHQQKFCVQAVNRLIDHFPYNVCEVRLDMWP